MLGPSLILASAILGQHCGRAVVVQQQVAAPAYGYQAAAVQAYAPVVKELQFVAVEPSYNAAIVGDYIRRERIAADAAAETEALRREVRELRLAMEALTRAALAAPDEPYAPPVATVVAPSPQAPYQSPPPAAPSRPTKDLPTPQAPGKQWGGGDAAPPLPSPYPDPSAPPDPTAAVPQPPADVLAIMQQHCASCHTAPRAKGGFALFEPTGLVAPLDAEQRRGAASQVISGAMPESGPALTNEEVQALVAWLNS